MAEITRRHSTILAKYCDLIIDYRDAWNMKTYSDLNNFVSPFTNHILDFTVCLSLATLTKGLTVTMKVCPHKGCPYQS